MFPEVTLTETTREDVGRMAEWLNDAEVNAMWYGLGMMESRCTTGILPMNCSTPRMRN